MGNFRKPSNCSCGPGGYRSWGNRWVVIERRKRPKTSRLKCLDCGWKWWSGCQYVDKLRDHKERNRTGMTDQDVIDMICEGRLVVLVDEPRVFTFYSRWRENGVILHESNGSTYRFVTICHRNKKKRVALHRLVWMFANRSVVPEGFDIDHVSGNSDAIHNLRLLERSNNRKRGYIDQEDDIPF